MPAAGICGRASMIRVGLDLGWGWVQQTGGGVLGGSGGAEREKNVGGGDSQGCVAIVVYNTQLHLSAGKYDGGSFFRESWVLLCCCYSSCPWQHCYCCVCLHISIQTHPQLP